MEKERKQTRQIPIVAIRDSIVFPHTDVVLSFGRKKSVAAVNTAFQNDRVIGIFTQKDTRTSNPGQEDVYKVGTIATITQMMSTEGEIHAVIRGQARVKLVEVVSNDPYLVAEVEELPVSRQTSAEVTALANKLTSQFKKSVNLGKQAEILTVMRLVSGKVNPRELVDRVASLLDISTSKKQKLLETSSLTARLEDVLKLLTEEMKVLELEKTIYTKTQKRFEDKMRKAMLREKKKNIE